jgi:exonuclease SbcD
VSASFKLLVTADLHLSNQLPHARVQADGLTDRLNDQLEAMEWMVDLARTHRVDAVVIAGDLYDRRTVDALTLRHSLAALKRFAPMGVLIVPGNHEAHAEGSDRYLPEFFTEAGHDHISFFGFEDVVEPVPWLALHSLPYASQARSAQMLEAIQARVAEDPKRRHFLFAHVAVRGAKVGAWSSDAGLEPAVLEQGFEKVFLGHYHAAQSVSAKCECIGAPWQLTFGEEDNRGRVLLVEAFEDSRRSTKVEALSIDAPRFHSVNSGGVEAAIEAPGIQPGDFVRIVIEATSAEFPAKRAEIEPYRTTLEERGCRVKVLHKPIYHHEDRTGAEEKGILSLEELVSSYPDLAVAGETSRDRLREIGLDILRRAREGR